MLCIVGKSLWDIVCKVLNYTNGMKCLAPLTQEMCCTLFSIPFGRVPAKLKEIHKNLLKEGREGKSKSLNDVNHLMVAGMEPAGSSEFPKTNPRKNRFKTYEETVLDKEIPSST